MKPFARTSVAGALAAAVLMAGGARAATYAEVGDAGQTLTAAAYTGAGSSSPLTTIFGALGSESDADLYVITITTPSTFSASTNNAYTGNFNGPDTALFLFSAQGNAVATNDDANGDSIDSALPAGNSLYANLKAGTYYLGVSASQNEPVNVNNQLLFAGYPGGDTTAVRGPASGLNPTTENNFNSNAYDGAGDGQYEIDLTSTATAVNPSSVSAAPEPSTWALMMAGVCMAGAALQFGRRRNSVATT